MGIITLILYPFLPNIFYTNPKESLLLYKYHAKVDLIWMLLHIKKGTGTASLINTGNKTEKPPHKTVLG